MLALRSQRQEVLPQKAKSLRLRLKTEPIGQAHKNSQHAQDKDKYNLEFNLPSSRGASALISSKGGHQCYNAVTPRSEFTKGSEPAYSATE